MWQVESVGKAGFSKIDFPRWSMYTEYKYIVGKLNIYNISHGQNTGRGIGFWEKVKSLSKRSAPG